jgi:protoporphyrinogen oxidase
MQHVPVVILGAGLAGLSTATFVGPDCLVLEREHQPGGLARTDARGDRGQYLFDVTGHWLHLRHPHLRALVERVLGGCLLTVERKSAVYSNGVFTPYPFQANFAGLPPQVVKECLQGYVEAKLQEARGEFGEPRHFGEYIDRHFGAGIARHFMIPYNTRLWGVRPEEITAEWCGRFIPRPGLDEVIDGALGLRAHAMGYNASFVYPVAGGIGTLAHALAEPLRDRIRYGHEVTAIDPVRRVVRHAGGEVSYDRLVSSLPLPALIARLAGVDPALQAAAGRLRATRLRYLNVAVRGRGVLRGNHWVYVPEERFPFYRLGCFSNAVPYMAPEGESTLYVECSNLLGPEWTDARLKAALVEFLVEIGEASGPESLTFAEVREIPVAYVLFDHAYFDATRALHAALAGWGIDSIGRYGRWIYNSMEDSLQDGFETALRVKGEAT